MSDGKPQNTPFFLCQMEPGALAPVSMELLLRRCLRTFLISRKWLIPSSLLIKISIERQQMKNMFEEANLTPSLFPIPLACRSTVLSSQRLLLSSASITLPPSRMSSRSNQLIQTYISSSTTSPSMTTALATKLASPST